MQRQLVVGDTLKFQTEVPAYPATDGWTLKYRLVPIGAGTAIVLQATALGSGYEVDATPAVTQAWVPGEYNWFTWVEKVGARVTLKMRGVITLLPDPATVAPGTDLRSQARKALADAKSALARWTPTRRSYTIAGRSMEFNTTAEIVRLIHYWESELRKEETRDGDAPEISGRIYSRL